MRSGSKSQFTCTKLLSLFLIMVEVEAIQPPKLVLLSKSKVELHCSALWGHSYNCCLMLRNSMFGKQCMMRMLVTTELRKFP